MERSIVTGKGSYKVAELQGYEVETEIAPTSRLRNFATLKTHRGFSLLELMIAMFILIILLSVAVPTYQRSVRQAREVVLKENLFQMRRSIDQFRADKGKLPQSVEDLVSEKYLREKPIDPIIEKAEWNEIQGEDSNSPDGESGMIDVKSTAEGEDTNGVAFSEY